jgi:hypothetical protein
MADEPEYEVPETPMRATKARTHMFWSFMPKRRVRPKWDRAHKPPDAEIDRMMKEDKD